MAARKFAFDVEFAPDGTILQDNSAGVRRFDSDEVEAERQRAYESGKADSVALAERATAAALKDLAMAAGAALQTLDAESKAMRREAAQLALAAARKIADAALTRFGEDRALSAIEQAMDALRHGPRLLVRVPKDAAERLKPMIEAMAEEHHYAGKIVVRGEAGLSAGAVAIDWTDGVMRLDPADIADRIDTLIAAALASAESGDTP